MDKLRMAALRSLKGGKTPQQALKAFDKEIATSKALREQLCLEYLTNVAAGQMTVDTQDGHAGAASDATSQLSVDAQAIDAGASDREGAIQPLEPRDRVPPLSPNKPVRVHEHRRRAPGAADVAWKLQADAIFNTRKIGGREIGTLRFEQIGKLHGENIRRAAGHLLQSVQETEDAILLGFMVNHGVPVDPRMTIPELYTGEQVSGWAKKAKELTPLVVQRGVETYKQFIQKPEEIEYVA